MRGENMKSFILLIIGIIAAVLIIGGVAAFSVMHELGMGIDEVDSSTVGKVMDKVSNVASSGSSDDSSGSSSGSSDDSDNGGDIISNVLNEEVKENVQNGGGSYREVTYEDGGFRQYDTDTGELIGSSYESDQNKLPCME